MKTFIATFIFSAVLSCGTNKANHVGQKVVTENGELANDPDGEKIYKTSCVLCHGKDGKLGINGFKDLTKSEMDLPERIQIITNGKGTMMPMGQILSQEEIEAVATFTLTL